MFIIEPMKAEDARGELKVLFAQIKKQLGFIPPHFALFATIDLEAMKSFLEYNIKMLKHPKIQKELLPFLRLFIAKKECRGYCTNFNTQMLLGMKVPKELLENIDLQLDQLPLQKEQIVLLKKVLKALNTPQEFSKQDLDELYKNGFSDKDFFDLLYYASDFNAKSKMIEVYLKS